MTIRIGINGFGRIGRLAVRGIASHDGIELAHINDLKADAVTAAHLLEFDTVHGRYAGEVGVDGDTILSMVDRSRPAPTTSPGTSRGLIWGSIS